LMREQMQSGSKQGTIAQAHAREIAWERELLRTYSARNAAALFEKFKRNQTWQTPTLVLLKTVAFPTGEADSLASDARARYVPRALLKKWQSALVDRERTTAGGEGALNRELFKKSAQVVEQMREAGVHLLAGTDTGAPFLFPGFALHDELALLVQAALTPMEALQAATKSSAEFLGKSSVEGTIERGKIANLLLLDASPLDDIRNTRRISDVIVRGRLLNRRALDDLLSSVEKFAAAN
jgi:hypothetical protein